MNPTEACKWTDEHIGAALWLGISVGVFVTVALRLVFDMALSLFDILHKRWRKRHGLGN